MPKERDAKVGVDLAILVAVGALLAVVSIQLSLVDRAIGQLDRWDTLNLNGILALVVFLPIGSTVYAARRYREAMRIREELARLTLRDNLTGLPNRLFLSEWLEAQLQLAQRNDTRLAVLFVDLDRFKMVNDTYGHDVGDAVLTTIAKRIRHVVADQAGSRVVRYAGDEFLVICREDALRPTAERLARRVLAALDEPFQVSTDTLRVGASLGLAISEQDDTVDALVHRADAAMYDAKARDDGRPVLYDDAVHGDGFSPATLEPHLRKAAEEGGFRLVYQPVVDVVTGQMVAVEALLRWNHPERGPVPPVEFIPVLEDSGLIVAVGAWVVEEAIGQAHRWHRAYPDRAPLRVTVNVSARQLAQSGFDQHVQALLRAQPVPPGSICLEITEGALMVDIDAAWSSLRLLKRLGIRLALDDFGTGYSSLSYIRNFNLDMLKIDRSFVKGLGESVEDTAIVEHVIGMSRALGMVTVGEGVETPRQLSELHRLGCELAQGYLLSRPVAPEQIDTILSRGGELCRPGGGRVLGIVADGSASRRSPSVFDEPSDPMVRQPTSVGVATGTPPVDAEQ